MCTADLHWPPDPAWGLSLARVARSISMQAGVIAELPGESCLACLYSCHAYSVFDSPEITVFCLVILQLHIFGFPRGK